jgi:hypothetical protein
MAHRFICGFMNLFTQKPRGSVLNTCQPHRTMATPAESQVFRTPHSSRALPVQQITSSIRDVCREERENTLTNILVCIVPESTMTPVHLSVHVMLMSGYMHP